MSQNRTMWPQCLDELKVQGWRPITFAKVCIRLRCMTMAQCLTLVSRRLAWTEWICRRDYMAQGCDKAEPLDWKPTTVFALRVWSNYWTTFSCSLRREWMACNQGFSSLRFGKRARYTADHWGGSGLPFKA